MSHRRGAGLSRGRVSGGARTRLGCRVRRAPRPGGNGALDYRCAPWPEPRSGPRVAVPTVMVPTVVVATIMVAAIMVATAGAETEHGGQLQVELEPGSQVGSQAGATVAAHRMVGRLGRRRAAGEDAERDGRPDQQSGGDASNRTHGSPVVGGVVLTPRHVPLGSGCASPSTRQIAVVRRAADRSIPVNPGGYRRVSHPAARVCECAASGHPAMRGLCPPMAVACQGAGREGASGRPGEAAPGMTPGRVARAEPDQIRM